MPAGGGASTNLPGQDALDIKVCMNILKKAIVLFPLVIMLIIFIIRKTMTYPPEEQPDVPSGHPLDTPWVMDGVERTNSNSTLLAVLLSSNTSTTIATIGDS